MNTSDLLKKIFFEQFFLIYNIVNFISLYTLFCNNVYNLQELSSFSKRHLFVKHTYFISHMDKGRRNNNMNCLLALSFYAFPFNHRLWQAEVKTKQGIEK
jgi:hypothetical protein